MKIGRLLITFISITIQGKADLIVNGSFENFTLSGSPLDSTHSGYYEFYGPPVTASNTELTGWSLTGNSAAFPNQVDLVGPQLWAAYAGSYSLDMSGQHGSAGVIQQSFLTTPGDQYTLSFGYANNPGATGDSMNVTVTGTGLLLNQNLSHTTSNVSNMDWTLFSQSFTADSTTTTLAFSGVTNSGFGIAIDNVSVDTSATPEPLPAGLMGVSLASLCFLRVNRRYRTSH